MQSVSSRIWTRVAVSNSIDDNHYTICIYNNYLKLLFFTKDYYEFHETIYQLYDVKFSYLILIPLVSSNHF